MCDNALQHITDCFIMFIIYMVWYDMHDINLNLKETIISLLFSFMKDFYSWLISFRFNEFLKGSNDHTLKTA